MDNIEKTAFDLRQKLVDQLKAQGHIRTARVEAAFRAVPRHIFVPSAELEQAYSNVYIPTRERDGVIISSSSQPAIMAIMLEHLDVQPGQRVLEIGAGTGYNAALLAHLVGPTGSVVTIDIDEDITTAARAQLQAAGYPQVQVFCGDGASGYTPLAPYDAIMLTACAADIMPAWRTQLIAGGRLVLPFKLTRISVRNWFLSDQVLLTLEKTADHLASIAIDACGFMPLRGAFALPASCQITLPGALTMVTSGDISAESVTDALQKPYHDTALDIELNSAELLSLRLWLAMLNADHCDFYREGSAASDDAVPTLMQVPGTPLINIGLYATGQLCFLVTAGQVEAIRSFKLAVRSFGTTDTLVQHYIQQIAIWHQIGRLLQWYQYGLPDGLRVRVYPENAKCKPGPNEYIVERPASRLIFQW